MVPVSLTITSLMVGALTPDPPLRPPPLPDGSIPRPVTLTFEANVTTSLSLAVSTGRLPGVAGYRSNVASGPAPSGSSVSPEISPMRRSEAFMV